MMPLFLAFLAWAAPARAADVDFVQADWSAGAASASTTTAAAGWKAFDSQDGNALTFSTAVQSRTNVPATWYQTDASTQASGFARAGSLFSSTTLVGAGAGTSLALALQETVVARAAALAQARELMSAAYHPGTKKVYLFGGRNPDGTVTNQVLEYDPAADTLQAAADSLPTARAGTAAAFDPFTASIFVFGGFVTGGAETASIVKYDPVGHSVTSAAGSLPTARSLLSAAYHAGTFRIYLFGGRQLGAGVHLSQIVEFNPLSEAVVTVATSLPSGRIDTAAVYDPRSNDILVFGGNSTGTWLSEVVAFHAGGSSRTLLSPLPAPRAGMSAVRHPLTGKIYLYGGENAGTPSTEVLQYDPEARTVAPRPAVLPSARARTAAAADSRGLGLFIFGGTGTAAGFSDVLQNVQIASGIYRSAVYDLSNLSQLGALSWTPAVQADSSAAVGMSVRAGNVPTPGATWSNGGDFVAVANGGSLAPLGANRYIQYSATFTTTNVSTTPFIDNLTVTYGQTAPSATLTSTAFDSLQTGNVLRRLRWTGSFPPGTTVQFQLRTAPDGGGGFPGAWTAWLGPAGTTDYYTNPGGGDAINPLHSDAVGDRFFQYQALLLSSGTLLPPAVTSVTISVNHLPGAPTLNSLVATSSTDIRPTWTDNSNNETDFVLSTGTLPGAANLGLSTPTANSAGTGGQQAAVAGGLQPNTAYFVRVRARDTPDSLLSAFSNELNIFTLANPPTGVAVSSIAFTSVTLSWNAAGNPPSTPYEVSMSTDGFLTAVSTPVTFVAGLTATTTDLLGLSPGTTYSFRLRALNGNAIPTAFSASTAAQTVPTALAGLDGGALGVSSISWHWDSSGPAARYRVNLATGGPPLADTALTSFTLTGLSSNTAYAIRVQPYDDTAAGALSAPSTFFTLAASPAPLAAVSQGTGTVALTWASNGNPGATRFEVSLSTVGFPVSVSTPVPLAASFTATAAAFGGLSAGTTHFWRVRAFNGDGLPTAFSAASTQTLPGTIAAPAGAALGISSLAWTWSNTAGPAAAFFSVVRASNGVVLATTAAASFTESGLLPDTPYGLQVTAVDDSGAGALSAGTTVFTLADRPTGTSVAAVFTDSMTLTWSAASNPAHTVFQVEVATQGGAFLLDSAATGTARTLVNLRADTTFFARVRAVNGDGAFTAYGLTVSSFVAGRLPLRASGFLAAPAGGARVRLSWTVSPTTTVARYDLFSDGASGAIDYAVLFASVPAATTSFLSPPLTPNATYLFGLRTVDERGTSDRNTDVTASAVALSTGAALSVFVRSPPAGARVWGDRLTVSAGLLAGAAGDVSRVLFQFRASTTAAWTDMVPAEPGHPNPALEGPFSVLWDVTGLALGTYQVRGIARGASGTDDPAPPATALLIDSAVPDRQESRLAAGRVLTRVKVYRTAPAELEAAAPGGAFTTRVTLATGCVAADSDVLRVDGAPTALPVVPSSLAVTGIFRDISLESGQSALSAGRCATLGFERLDRDGDRRVDGTEVRADNLVIASYDAAAGLWRRDFPTRASSDSGSAVSGDTSHFTLFGVFSPAAADLSGVRVYPVPWRPNNADPDDGKPWTPGDPTSGIVFDTLPGDTRITVYTVAGSIVWDSPGNSVGGLRRWDVRTGDGRDAASGVYFAVIAAPGGATRVEKLVVIR